MGSARIRAPHRTRACGWARPQLPRSFAAHPSSAFVTPAPPPRPTGTPRAQGCHHRHDLTPMSGIAVGRVGAARRTRSDASVPAGAHADPDTAPRENDITKQKARRFATCGRRASLLQVRVMLTGTAALRSYLDPKNQ